MTRDSKLWWVVIAGSVLTAMTGHFDLLHKAFPTMPVYVDAQIELVSMIIGIVSGVMRMSPLPISSEGRTEAIRLKAEQADTAHVAATNAAITADAAATATALAADAAAEANTESQKAADPK